MPYADRAPKRNRFFASPSKPTKNSSKSCLEGIFENVAVAREMAEIQLKDEPDHAPALAVLKAADRLEGWREYLAKNPAASVAVADAQALEIHFSELAHGPHVAAALKAHEGRKNKRDTASTQRIAKQRDAYLVARRTKGNAEDVLAAYNRECDRIGVPVCSTPDALRRRRLDWKKRGL